MGVEQETSLFSAPTLCDATSDGGITIPLPPQLDKGRIQEGFLNV